MPDRFFEDEYEAAEAKSEPLNSIKCEEDKLAFVESNKGLLLDALLAIIFN